MDAHQNKIWNGGNASEIMKESRLDFVTDIKTENLIGAHVKLASDHYSLVKRYLAPAPIWVRHLAVWHMRRAIVHAKKADSLGLQNTDQVDVVSRILKQAPKWLGGDLHRAEQIIEMALKSDEMKIHTKALLLITLGEIKFQGGMPYELAKTYFNSAMEYTREISFAEQEQRCRVLFGVGRFFAEFGDTPSVQSWGVDVLDEALGLADRAASDQVDKIRNEARRILRKILESYAIDIN